MGDDGLPGRVAASAVMVWSGSGIWNTEPRPAMPVAIPTWRNVLLAPDAMPLRSGGTTEMADEASTGLTVPIPMPAMMKPGSSTVQLETHGSWPSPGSRRR